MVEGVKGFRAELQLSALGEPEPLVHRDVPIVASGADDVVSGRGAPLEGSWRREGRRAKPLEPGPRIGDRRDDVRPVAGAAPEPEVIDAVAYGERVSRLERGDAGYLPSSDQCLLGASAGILEERDGVNDAGDQDLPSVKTGGTVVPAGVERIVDIGEEFAVDNVECV